MGFCHSNQLMKQMLMPVPAPGGIIAKRVLNFFWLVDCSGSMAGTKIDTVNRAIREVLPDIEKAAKANPSADLRMSAIRFADDAHWHVGPPPVPLDQFHWPPLAAGGRTSTARALGLLAAELDVERMPRRGFPPVCILLSDGYCTDAEGDYHRAIADLQALPWGRKAIRLAIGIGADYNTEELQAFVSQPEVGVLHADKPQALVKYIKWASTAAVSSSSQSRSHLAENSRHDQAVLLLEPPPLADLPALTFVGAGDVF